MRLTVLGGGGFRVPLVYRALLDDEGALGVGEVALYDIDAARLDSIGRVLQQMAMGRVRAPRVVATTDLADAVRGADFVFCAIRVGGLDARTVDERVAIAEGVVGQETVGAGGVCFGLRTIPTMLRMAETVAEQAPKAWVINFTNPAGMITEAMAGVLGDRVIGICDTPMGLCRRVARSLGVDPGKAWFEYFGLNHLGWLRAVLVDGHDRLPELLASDDALGSFEEGRLFGPEWLRALRMIPSEYLFYYYRNAEGVESGRSRSQTRGEFLRDQQTRFYTAVEADPARAYEEWRRVWHEREATYMQDGRDAAGAGERDADDTGGGGYETVALAVMSAIARGERTVLILGTRNRSAIPALDSGAVVEVPCVVTENGGRPLAVGDVPAHAAALMQTIKAVERATIEAARSGSRPAALRAMGLHPLVGSVGVAERMLDAYITRLPDLGYLDGLPGRRTSEQRGRRGW